MSGSRGPFFLGFALPAAIGAKLANELAMPLAIVVWNNDGYGQIRDGMIQRGILKSA